MTKLKWGMIGGGEGSQIGPAHRLGAGLDGLFEFSAGALDHRPDEGLDYGKRLGLGDRAYGSWQDMLEGEKKRDDRVDLVFGDFLAVIVQDEGRVSASKFSRLYDVL